MIIMILIILAKAGLRPARLRLGPEYSFGVFSMSRFAPLGLSLVELVVRIKLYKQTNRQTLSKIGSEDKTFSQ